MWAPFGIALCVTRAFAWFPWLIGYALADSIGFGRVYMRCTLPMMGMWVRVMGLHNLNESKSDIIVCNHISDFDGVALWAACPIADLMLVLNDHWKPVVRLTQRVGFPVSVLWTMAGGTKERITQHVVEQPQGSKHSRRLLIFPEGMTTNGKALCKFHNFIFSLKQPVVPTAVACWNPWPINIDYAGSDLKNNIFILFFLPFVVYTYNFMPEVIPDPTARPDEVCAHVKEMLCGSLGVPGAEFETKDKTELKRLHKEGKIKNP